jgi:hypothetical protein
MKAPQSCGAFRLFTAVKNDDLHHLTNITFIVDNQVFKFGITS